MGSALESLRSVSRVCIGHVQVILPINDVINSVLSPVCPRNVEFVAKVMYMLRPYSRSNVWNKKRMETFAQIDSSSSSSAISSNRSGAAADSSRRRSVASSGCTEAATAGSSCGSGAVGSDAINGGIRGVEVGSSRGSCLAATAAEPGQCGGA